MKTKEQLKKEQQELEIIKIVFDESERLRGTSFEEYLKSHKKENLGKQIEEKEDQVEKKVMTKEERAFEDYTLSGGQKSFSEFQEMGEII